MTICSLAASMSSERTTDPSTLLFANRQILAELNAVRAAALRRHCAFQSLHTDFEQVFCAHGRIPAEETTCVSVPLVQSQIIPSSAAAFQPHKKRRISLGL